jgi:hypothetical protein
VKISSLLNASECAGAWDIDDGYVVDDGYIVDEGYVVDECFASDYLEGCFGIRSGMLRFD